MATETKYSPLFCGELLKHFRRGYSFASFAAVAKVDRTVLYDWVKAHPEFARAKAIGEAASLKYWEGLGLKGIKGQFEGFSASTYIYTMKCRFRKYGYNEQAPADDADDFSDITNEETGKLIEMARFKRKADGGT